MKSKRVRGVEQRFRIESATSTYDRYSADFLSAGKFPCENDCYYVSDRLDPFPQHLVVQLDEPVQLTRIEVVADGVLVPTAFDLFVDREESWARVPQADDYVRVGRVPFDPPKTGVGRSKKQLRSVTVNVRASALRLSFLGCFEDGRNEYGQIALHGLRVWGLPLAPPSVLQRQLHQEEEEAAGARKSQWKSPPSPRPGTAESGMTQVSAISATSAAAYARALAARSKASSHSGQAKPKKQSPKPQPSGTTVAAIDHMLHRLGLGGDEVAREKTPSASESVAQADQDAEERRLRDLRQGDASLGAVATIIANLTHRKDNCLRLEYYDEAHALKLALEEARGHEQEMVKKVLAKQKAIGAEDYEKASALKQELKQLQFRVEQVAERMAARDPLHSGVLATEPEGRVWNTGGDEYDQASMFSGSVNKFGLPDIGSLGGESEPSPAVAAEDGATAAALAEDVPSLEDNVPGAIKAMPLNLVVQEASLAPHSADPPGSGAALPEPEALAGSKELELQGLFELFSQHTVRCFWSTQWILRRYGIREISRRVDSLSTISPAVFRAVVLLARRNCAETVTQVYVPVQSLLLHLLTLTAEVDRDSDLLDEVSRRRLDFIAEDCAGKYAHSSPRIRSLAARVLHALLHRHDDARLTPARLLQIAVKCAPPVADWRARFAKLVLLQQLIARFDDLESSESDWSSVPDFVVECLHNNNRHVRSAAIKVWRGLTTVLSARWTEGKLEAARAKALRMHRETLES